MRREVCVLVLAATVACAGEKSGEEMRAPDGIGAGRGADTAGVVKRDSIPPPADTVMARDTAGQL